MSKTNKAASRITLADDRLHGYSGPLDIITLRRRTWWQRLLRRPATRSQRVYGDVRGSSARAWRR